MLVWLIDADGPRGNLQCRRKVNLPIAIARRLIRQGIAELIETTALEAPENAMLPRARPRIVTEHG